MIIAPFQHLCLYLIQTNLDRLMQPLFFQVRDTLLYSNPATATINLAEASGELPPVIEVEPWLIIPLVSSNGHKWIISTITDPNGDLDTILWEFEGTPYPNTVIEDATTTTPKITVTGGSDGNFKVKCTATDVLGNYSTAIVTVIVGTYVIEVEPIPVIGSESEAETIYEIMITGRH